MRVSHDLPNLPQIRELDPFNGFLYELDKVKSANERQEYDIDIKFFNIILDD